MAKDSVKYEVGVDGIHGSWPVAEHLVAHNVILSSLQCLTKFEVHHSDHDLMYFNAIKGLRKSDPMRKEGVREDNIIFVRYIALIQVDIV